MEPETTPQTQSLQEQPTTAGTPPKRQGFLKKRLIFLVGGLFLFIVLALFLITTSFRGTPPVTPPDENRNISTEKAEIIDEIVEYIDSQKTPEGYNNFISHFEEVCLSSEVNYCPFEDVNVLPINNSWSALAYYSVYEITKDSNYLAKAYRDLALLNDYCAEQPEECLWVLAQPGIIYKRTNNEIARQTLDNVGELLLTNSQTDNLMLLSIEARELALLYSITQDSRYRVESENRLTQARDNLNRGLSGDTFSRASNPAQACWYTLAAAELGRTTGDEKFLSEAKRIENDVFFQSHKFTTLFSVNVQPCIETHLIIADATRSRESYGPGIILLRDLESNFWDSKENPKIWGEGGIAAVRFNAEIEPPQLKQQVNLTDTSYYLYLLNLEVNNTLE